MAIVLRPCAMCRGQVELAKIDKVVGEAAPLKMTVFGMPALKCAKGHAAPVHQDFLLWMMGELRGTHAPGIPAAEEKGMVFKKRLCACGKELPGKAERRQAFGFDLAYQGTAPFRVELEMPLYKCAGCGKEQLRSQADLRKASTHALVEICDSAGFPHSG